MITEIPGFSDLIHDSQSTFRVLLNALSRPGTINQITVELIPPSGLNLAAAAAALTLLDLEVQVWLQPGLDESAKNWLSFHTGCCLTENTMQADFAVIWDINSMPKLSEFKLGTAVAPEASTTLLIQLEVFPQQVATSKVQMTQLTGAGINEEITMPIALPDTFWQQWQQNYNSYPLGVDIYFLSKNQAIGLPRTSCITNSSNSN